MSNKQQSYGEHKEILTFVFSQDIKMTVFWHDTHSLCRSAQMSGLQAVVELRGAVVGVRLVLLVGCLVVVGGGGGLQ